LKWIYELLVTLRLNTNSGDKSQLPQSHLLGVYLITQNSL